MYLAWIAAPFCLAALGNAALGQTNTVLLPTVTVVATNQGSAITSQNLASAGSQKLEVPGGFTLKDAAEADLGRATSFQDLLGEVPGLTLQSENGLEITKVSSRGSGILSEDEPIGIIFLLDGFPFNQGDGEAILEDFSISSIKYAEVFRGANAFKYGATTLGGAINLSSKTGYDGDPFQIRVEGGSYGFIQGQSSAGGVEGPLDYFASVSGRSRDGYRMHSRENTENLFASFGYRLNNNLENRLYFSLAKTDRQIPGGVTQDQLNQDPRGVDQQSIDQDLNKEWQYLRIADKVGFKNEVEQADAGAFWWHRNLESRGLFTPDSPAGIQGYYSDNFGIVLNSRTETQVFGQKNIFTIGFTPTLEREADANFENLSGSKGAMTARDNELSINAPLFAEDQQYVTENLSLIGGIQAIYVQRHFSDYFNDTPSGDQSANRVYRGLNPKAGVIYELNEQNQIYANFCKSWQPPSFDNMVEFGDNPGDSLEFTPLQPQNAWTAEAGTRGEEGRFGWELSLYHSWVRNELLDINNAVGVDRGAVNIARSYHQGIEAGFDIQLLNQSVDKTSGHQQQDQLTLKQTYTLIFARRGSFRHCRSSTRLVFSRHSR